MNDSNRVRKWNIDLCTQGSELTLTKLLLCARHGVGLFGRICSFNHLNDSMMEISLFPHSLNEELRHREFK